MDDYEYRTVPFDQTEEVGRPKCECGLNGEDGDGSIRVIWKYSHDRRDRTKEKK